MIDMMNFVIDNKFMPVMGLVAITVFFIGFAKCFR